MSKYFRFVPVVLLSLYLLSKIGPYIKTPDGPNGYEPTASQKELLYPIINSLKEYPDAATDFGNLSNGLALVVESEEVILKTTDDVRRAHENAGALAIQAGEIPRIPSYARNVNDFITSEVGNENVPLDGDKKKKIIEAFKALSWATNQ